MPAIHIVCFLWHWKGFWSSPTNNHPSSNAKYRHDGKHTSLRLQPPETSHLPSTSRSNTIICQKSRNRHPSRISNIMPLNHHRNLDILIYYFRVHKNLHHINAYRLTSEATQFSNFRQYSQKLLQQYILCEQDGQ